MSTSGGGWEPQGWQSQWQSGWQQDQQQQDAQQQPQQPPRQGNWQQRPDGQWVQTGGGTNGKSTAALVLGILGLVFCPFICSIAALILGYQARGEIDRSGGMQTGRGNATAGVVLGWIGIALTVAFVGLIVIGVLAGGDSSGGGTVSGAPA